jgi:hypothetical protein
LSVLVWAAFIVLAAVEGYIIYRFARMGERVLIKAVVPLFFLYAVFFLAAHFFRLRIPEAVMIFTMLSIFSHTFLGFFLRFCEKAKPFDRCNHAFGSFAYSQAVYFTLTSLFSEAIPDLFAAIIIGSLGVTLGVFVEIIEFFLDSRKKKGLQFQKDLRDSNLDLIADVIGSAAAGAFASLFLL